MKNKKTTIYRYEIAPQPHTQIYLNPFNQIVIKQIDVTLIEGDFEEVTVVISKNNIPYLMSAIKNLLLGR